MILYDYYRSSAAYRVRLALALKGVAVEHIPVNLADGEQRRPDYLSINPQGLVPALRLDDGDLLTQSLAIIEYLDATHPQPPLIPQNPLAAAKCRAVAFAIGCDIHPLANPRVIAYLKDEFGADDAALARYREKWIGAGLAAVERLVRPGPFCFGAAPSLADICLIPQLYNARRFGVSLDSFANLVAIDEACARLPAFQAAHPSRQADAP